MCIENCPFCGAVPQKRINPGGRSMHDHRYTYHQCPTICCPAHDFRITYEREQIWNTRKYFPKDQLESIVEIAIAKAKEKLLQERRYRINDYEEGGDEFS